MIVQPVIAILFKFFLVQRLDAQIIKFCLGNQALQQVYSLPYIRKEFYSYSNSVNTAKRVNRIKPAIFPGNKDRIQSFLFYCVILKVCTAQNPTPAFI